MDVNIEKKNKGEHGDLKSGSHPAQAPLPVGCLSLAFSVLSCLLHPSLSLSSLNLPPNTSPTSTEYDFIAQTLSLSLYPGIICLGRFIG